MTTTVSKNNLNRHPFGIKPTDYIHEDDGCFVFDEYTNPQALVHFVVVPKKRIPTLCDVTEEDERFLGHLLLVARDVALSRGLHATGYHVIVDEDHSTERLKAVHVFGRTLQHMLWPLGPGARL